MAYKRRDVQDFVTILDKDLYDNLQDGIDEAKEAVKKLQADESTLVLTATVEE